MFKNEDSFLEQLGVVTLGIYFLLASILRENFAKLHLSFSFLNFPIFTGEIFLFICILICLRLIIIGKIQLTKWHYYFFVYLAFILLWVSFDYVRLHAQALALRNGTLFLYPVFAFFAYSFYSSVTYSFKERFQFLIIVLLFLAGINNRAGFFSFIYLILFFVVLADVSKSWRYIIGVAVLLLWPYSAFLSGARTWWVGSIVASIFIIFVYVKYFLNLNNQWKIVWGLIGGVILLYSAIYFADKGQFLSLITPKEVIKRYRHDLGLIKIKQAETEYHPKDLHINLYNSEEDQKRLSNFLAQYYKGFLGEKEFIHFPSFAHKPKNSDVINLKIENSLRNQKLISKENAQSFSTTTQVHNLESSKMDVVKKSLPECNKNPGRELGVAYDNIIFRLLIWKDMMHELWENKNIFGVGMGHPQRSRSIEILNWASSEWERDGWITPHNSFLHLIYRGGIVGIAIICTIFLVLYGLIKDFIRKRSIVGVFLSGILIYGLVSANFLLILELPYYAIPYWTIFGLTLAYRKDLLSRNLVPEYNKG